MKNNVVIHTKTQSEYDQVYNDGDGFRIDNNEIIDEEDSDRRLTREQVEFLIKKLEE
jgi:hypothetical protein